MFRDLKEYQEIAKIYADKVSKPENLEENRNQMAMKLRQEREANKPAPEPKVKPTYQSNRDKMIQSRSANRPKSREEVGLKNNVVKKPSPFERKFGAEKNQQRLKQSGLAKPSTAEIRAANPKVVPGTRTNEVGAQGGGKPSSGDLSMFKDKPAPKPEVSTMTKQGKPRTKAQMMAAKRIAAGKSISDVKQSSRDAMKARAAERFAAFKAKRAEKKAAMEEYTPYDIVLEYLLSSEQVATIEEANYVMTEMDAETIQGIVEEQKKNFDEGAGVAAAALAGGLLTYGLYKRNQYKKDAEKRDEKTNFGKIQKATDAKNKMLRDAGMGGN